MVTVIVPTFLTASETVTGAVPLTPVTVVALMVHFFPSSPMNDPDTLLVSFLGFTLPSFSSTIPTTSQPLYVTPCSFTTFGAL